jgi:two-component system sensor histidine kinase RegB
MIQSLKLVTNIRLIHLRWLSVAGMLVAALISQKLLDSSELVASLSLYALAVGMINASLMYSSYFLRDGKVKSLVLSPLAQLMLDLVLWSGYVYLSGGAANPLISVFLPLVAFGAILLTEKQAWTVGLLSIVTYSLLWKFHIPLPMADNMDHAHMHDATSQHLLGMWVVFVVSALVLVWFVSRMGQAIRERDAALAQAKEKALRSDWIFSMSSLAASAAHEMSTPLATLHILLDDMLENAGHLSQQMKDDVLLMQKQVDICKSALSQLTRRAGQPRNAPLTGIQATTWLQALVDGWSTLHPAVSVQLQIAQDFEVGRLGADITLERALTNLLDNAMNAGATQVAIGARQSAGEMILTIDDNGNGISEAALEAFRLWQPVESASGMGIGLMLCRSTVEQLGGALELEQQGAGGTRATLRLRVAAERSAA